MQKKYDAIYLMVVSQEAIGDDEQGRVARQGLQSLATSDPFFGMLWSQARTEHPPFQEVRRVRQPDQPLGAITAAFRDWLREAAVAVGEDRWDSYFFRATVPPLSAPATASELLVYFHAVGADIVDPVRFIVDYTLAGRGGNADRLRELLTGTTRCQFCERVVDPAIRAARQGSVGCPYCGQVWMQPMAQAVGGGRGHGGDLDL